MLSTFHKELISKGWILVSTIEHRVLVAARRTAVLTNNRANCCVDQEPGQGTVSRRSWRS